MTKAPNIAANKMAAASSALLVRRWAGKIEGPEAGAPPGSGAGLVDPLQHALRPGRRVLRVEEGLLHAIAEGGDVGRGHLDALALEEALGIGLGLDHAFVVEGLGLRLGGLDGGLLVGRQPVPEPAGKREEDV